MPYLKTDWVNNEAPYINATNLNNIENGVEFNDSRATNVKNKVQNITPQIWVNKSNIDDNTANISALEAGEVPQGAWTPTAGTEYPTPATIGFSWYISALNSNGYLYTAGDLVGLTANNMDKILYTDNGWSLVQNDVIETIDNGIVGTMNNPLLDIPLASSLEINSGTGSITFTRNSIATYIDRYGILNYVDIDEPRFEASGLFVERSSRNLVIQSGNFTDTAWGKSEVSLSTDGTRTPDNISEATKCTFIDGVQGYFRQTVTVTPLKKVPTSFWVLGGIGQTITLETKGVVNQQPHQSNHTLTGEWERISNDGIIDWSDQTDTEVRCTLRHGSADTAHEIYVAFGQIEESEYTTSYIPTTTAPVTREADLCSVSLDNTYPSLTDQYGLCCDFDYLHEDINQVVISLGDPASIGLGSSGDIQYTKESVTIAGTQTYPNTQYRAILSSGDTQYLNGVNSAVNSTVRATTYTTIFTLGSGADADTTSLIGHIRNVRFYDLELSPTQARIA